MVPAVVPSTTSGTLPVPPQPDGPGHRTSSTAGRLRLVVALIALVAVACGGDDSDDPGGAAGTVVTSGGGAGTEDAEDEALDDDELAEVRIAFVPATTGLLLHIAEEQGYFEDNGLDVSLTPATNISDIPPSLGRQFDISLGTATDLIRAVDGGLDIVQVAGNTNSTEDNPFVQLIVGADSGIAAISDLEGKTVASPTLSGVIHTAVLYWAQQEGVDPSTINGVQVPPPNLPDQLQAGRADAVEALEPFASQLLSAGNVSLGDPFAAIRLPLATNFWIAERAWARENGDVIEGFRDALDQALELVQEDEVGARATLQAFTELPPAVAQRTPLPTFNLEVRTDDLATWIEVLEALGEDVGDVEASELVLAGGS